jgi:hypothetical protein
MQNTGLPQGSALDGLDTVQAVNAKVNLVAMNVVLNPRTNGFHESGCCELLRGLPLAPLGFGWV